MKEKIELIILTGQNCKYKNGKIVLPESDERIVTDSLDTIKTSGKI